MPSAALFDLLPDFGASLPRHGTAPTEADQPKRHVQPAVDVAAIVARSVAEAETALEARLAAAHQAALETEREANAQEAKVFLESLGDDVGKRIAERIDAMEARIGEVVGASVTRILGNALGDDLRKRSLEALARSIQASIGGREATRIKVRGPQSLFEPLVAALGTHAERLDFVEASGFDLTVVIDDTVIETRMGEWADAFGEILA
ncbi:hypothetical protein [Mesorhizobium sp. A623]